MNRTEARDEVRRDLMQLEAAFEPIDGQRQPCALVDAVTFGSPFAPGADEDDQLPEPVVVWTFTGRHNRDALLGFAPTGADVTITGVTLVRRDPATGEVSCFSVVDWLDVLQQAGAVLYSRTVPAPVEPR
jgi:hypothetical protein